MVCLCMWCVCGIVCVCHCVWLCSLCVVCVVCEWCVWHVWCVWCVHRTMFGPYLPRQPAHRSPQILEGFGAPTAQAVRR